MNGRKQNLGGGGDLFSGILEVTGLGSKESSKSLDDELTQGQCRARVTQIGPGSCLKNSKSSCGDTYRNQGNMPVPIQPPQKTNETIL